MDVLRIVVTVSTLCTFSLCDERIISIELSLPDVMNSLSALDNAFSTLRTKHPEQIEVGKAVAENLMKKIKWEGLANIARLLDFQRRTAGQVMPHVQVGLGVAKSPIIKYPDNYFVNRLKVLLKLQKKENERNKPLNPPE